MFELATPAMSSGLALGLFWHWATTPEPIDDSVGLVEERRRERLRARSFIYRELPHLVVRLGSMIGQLMPARVESVRRSLRALHEDDWRADDFMAVKVLGLVPAITGAAIALLFAASPWIALCVPLVLLAGSPMLVESEMKGKARKHVKAVRGQMPFTLDLMALVLEAGGGTLQQSMRLAARETAGTPLGDEWKRVLLGIDQSRRVVDCFGDLSEQCGDADITEVGNAICSSETRGNPLKEGLRAVASRLRVMQVQWMERASEEAKVHITWPAMLVMAACMLVIVAPLLIGIPGLSSGNLFPK